MATLIDRAKLLAELEDRQGWQDEKEACRFKEGFDCGLEAVIEAIHNAPAVDAVPVVRCRDCKYRGMLARAMSFEVDRLEELLPCPFCGRDEALICSIVLHLNAEGEEVLGFYIWCPDCDFETGVYSKEEIVAAKWNRRSGDAYEGGKQIAR